MIFDAHTHLSADLLTVSHHRLAVASTPKECRTLEATCNKDSKLHFACGVHPWRSDSIPVEDLLPWLSKSSAIGEIGMDRVWCGVDLALQHRVFVQQLSLAAQLGKPVVLHTKGCEKDILAELSSFPHPILIHWYSCRDYLEDYLALGCYFTVGPDLSTNPAVQAVAREVPLGQLMIESDGASGLSWALGRIVEEWEIPACLEGLIRDIAAIQRLEEDVVRKALFENSMRFVTYHVGTSHN